MSIGWVSDNGSVTESFSGSSSAGEHRQSAPHANTGLAYLRLVRAPAVFSALGDPLVGLMLARGRLDGRGVPLGLAAGSLYLAGMALNDLADREEDSRERPDRPIPSGEVAASAAGALGTMLLVGGMVAARRAGAPYTGSALAIMVLAYDFGLKRSAVAGPIAMGACRGLSLLMGAEAGDGRSGIRSSSVAALVLGSYVAGLTTLARGETGSGAPAPVRGGALLAGAAVGAAALLGRAAAVPWVIAAGAMAAPALARAARDPMPAKVGPAVGAMVRAIPAIGGALAARRSPLHALTLLPLLALTRWGRKLIPVH